MRAYPGVAYDTDVTALLSEIDAVQNRAVDAAVRTAGFSETKVWNGQTGQCGDPASAQANTCYPPAVNYDPRYYLINGVSFDRSNPGRSALTVPATANNGNVLLRLVNAGLRMHVPAVVGLDMKLYAEDGNRLPGIPKVQNEVFLAAGKTYDVVINPPAASGSYTPAAFPIFDRQLSLSTNNQRDGGMQAYLQVAGGVAPAPAAAVANPDTFSLVAGNPVSVTSPAKGVMANDVGVYGVQVQTAPTGGTLVLNTNGTFTYTPASGTTADSFAYCGNGATSGSLCTTVTLAQCTGSCRGGPPVANTDTYTSNIASRLQISPPGVLANDIDPDGHPLTAQIVGTATGGSVTLNADGSFNVVPTAPPSGWGTSATVTLPLQRREFPEHAQRVAGDGERDLQRRQRPRRHPEGRPHRQDDAQRLPLDHRGRPDLQHRSGHPDEYRRDHGSGPGHQLPYQPHAAGGAGLCRHGFVRSRPDAAGRPGSMRPGQRRVPDDRIAKDAGEPEPGRP